MRIIISIVLFLNISILYAQQPRKKELIEEKEAELQTIQVDAFVTTIQEPFMRMQLSEQKSIWKKKVELHPEKAANWLGYYQTTRLYHIQKTGKKLSNSAKEELRQIAEKMLAQAKDYIGESYEKQIVSYYETEEYNYAKAKKYLLAAYKLNPSYSFLYTEMAKYYEFEGKPAERNAMCNKIYAVNDSSYIYRYCKELVKTLPQNSIVFTGGTYDAFALWRAAKANKKSITVISYDFLENNAYRSAVFKKARLKNTTYNKNHNQLYLQRLLKANAAKTNIYLLPTLKTQYLEPVAENIFNIGFAYQYVANANANNIALLYNNLMEFEFGKPNNGESKIMQNLMPGFISLYRYYKKKDNEETAQKIYLRAKYVAQRAGLWSSQYENYFK